MKLVHLILCLLATVSMTAQTNNVQDSLLSPDAMRQDIDSMYAQLQATHPNLYAWRSKANTDRDFIALRKSINRPMTSQQFSVAIAPFMAGFKDGHNFVSVDFDSRYFNEYAKTGRFFPLAVMILDNKLYCADNRFAPGIGNGTEISHINGIPAGKLISRLKQLWAADGEAAAVSITQRLFGYGLWWRYQWGNEWVLNILVKGEQIKKTVPGITKDDLMNLMFSNGQSNQLHLYPEYSLAVVQIDSYNYVSRTKAFIDSCFSVIKDRQLQNVALDLRRNGGGNSVIGDHFLAYVTKKNYKTIRSKRWRISPLVRSLPKDHWMVKAIEKFRATAREQGEYLQSPELAADAPVMLKDSNNYMPARFFLLTSARTFSSAHMTALSVKCGQLGTIIGQPTGERLDLTGEIIEYRLPNSKVDIVIPTATYQSACGNGSQVGVMPDHLVTTRIDDIRSGKDPELELLKKLVKK